VTGKFFKGRAINVVEEVRQDGSGHIKGFERKMREQYGLIKVNVTIRNVQFEILQSRRNLEDLQNLFVQNFHGFEMSYVPPLNTHLCWLYGVE